MPRISRATSSRVVPAAEEIPITGTLATLRPKGLLDKLRTLQPQEVVIDLFGEYVKEGEEIWSGGLVHLLNTLHFSPAASRIALNRLVARDMLWPARSGKFVYYRMTPKLARVLEEGRRQTFVSADAVWDGKWTLVWYSIPDNLRRARGRLSRWLGFRGFAPLQDGTWIAPGNRERDVSVLVKELGLQDFTLVFSAEFTPSRPARAVAEKVWNLEALAAAYVILLAEFRPYSLRRMQTQISPQEAFVVRTRAIEMFRETISQDPHLPDDVLGMKWKRREVIRAFETLQQGLAAAAGRYFRDQTRPPGRDAAADG